jgi:hypothetical protein
MALSKETVMKYYRTACLHLLGIWNPCLHCNSNHLTLEDGLEMLTFHIKAGPAPSENIS